MNRKYPFDIISDDRTISEKQAISLALKFLKQNNCTKEYYDCWKHSHKRMGKLLARDITIEEIIEDGIAYLKNYGYGLGSLFICIKASFDWVDVEIDLGFNHHYWPNINDKWKEQLGAEITIK